MKNLFLLALFACTVTVMNAQNNYDDLLEYIVDEKYERCLYKALKYTEDDETRKDALPYLYMSMAYFRIHQSDDPKLQEEYDDAYKDAMKYIIKFVKKDKENEYRAEFQDFMSELRLATIAEAEREMDEDKYIRSKRYWGYLTKMDENDPGAWLALAHSLVNNNSKRDAEEAYEMARKLINENGIDNLAEDQVNLLKMAVILNAEMYDEMGERSKAKEWLQLTESYFEEDPEFSVTYRTIVG
jgi:DNA-binding SARP family transcriptional activator